jgi:hypothetical protein
MMEEMEAVTMNRVEKDSIESSLMLVEQVVQNVQNPWKWFKNQLFIPYCKKVIYRI